MIFHDTKNWTDLDNMRGMLFFVQRIEELTFPYTLDSYKAASMSTQGLVIEAMDTLSMASEQNEDKVLKKFSHIYDELKLRFKGNSASKRISIIDYDRDIFPNIENGSIFTKIKYLAILHSELETEHYFSEIVSEIINNSSKVKNKKYIDYLACEFISLIQYRGLSRSYINKCIIDFFWGKNIINNPNQIKDFCQSVFPHLHKFSVIFGVRGAITKFDREVLSTYRVALIDNNDPKIDKSKKLKGFKSESGYEWAAIAECQATDCNSAAIIARKSIDDAFSLYNVFNYKDVLDISDKSWTTQLCCNSEIKEITPQTNSMQFIRDNTSFIALDKFKKYAKNISLNRGNDRKKFQNVLNIHSNSLNIINSDIQIVNMWTCLETLAPSRDNASNVQSVVNAVIPALMLGYVDRLIRYFLSDLLRFDRRLLGRCLNLAEFPSDIDLSQKVFFLLQDDRNDAARQLFVKECGTSELIRFRFFSIYEKLNDKDNLVNFLESHEQRVRWQIHRIYRTRNEIVHSGNSPRNISYFVENIHDYFDQVFNFCLNLSNWKSRYDTFAKCIQFSEINYKNYMSDIRDGNLNLAQWRLPRMKDRSFIFGEIN